MVDLSVISAERDILEGSVMSVLLATQAIRDNQVALAPERLMIIGLRSS